ncbi:tetraacyldisaccharide 4'-kinase [Robertkochia marina]|uniref:Tetraacyldisaccharide 4'-kinase n=1 Tax=Robertkochia marina TaxID=1227945 RepID=A0A4S3M0B8_9FLAO|nr:tetraacyldisaccharide 4'-kinase [Robertkochia marina]THD66353.1 tetraacyldisaccharide 4'-kinase [Robertkochia marina]TRZ44034.1 tetraacyldisaccharide 4'-kinase [Robertkochia marina]
MRLLRKILLPVSWLYGGIIWLRNYGYDRGWFSSTSFDMPVICIGNLRVGGTGKTPMTEYIARLLKDKYRVALLSRGYKRSSKGYVLAGPDARVGELGDEPFQFYRKFPDVAVAVDANRTEGIKRLRKQINPEVILLDDAFQHRKVRAGMYVLLTAYGDLYTDDVILPAGNLRDTKNQAARADIIVVTKCPAAMSTSEMKLIENRLQPKPHQQLCFATIDYDEFIYNRQGERMPLSGIPDHASLVTGIATPEPLLQHLDGLGLHYDHLSFPDHHNFSEGEIKNLQQKKFVLTTEKDFVRLESQLEKVYYLPIKIKMLGEGKAVLTAKLLSVIGNYSL